MNVFLASFLGCLLAIATSLAIGKQIIAWRFRGALQVRAGFRAPEPSSSSPIPAVVCACGRTQPVPVGQVGDGADPISFLEAIGWTYDLTRRSQEGSAPVRGWVCPFCPHSSDGGRPHSGVTG